LQEIAENKTSTLSINQWSQYAFDNGLPLCLWKHPLKDDLNLIIDTDGVKPPISLEIEELPAGFVFAPFEQDIEEKKGYLIEAKILIKTHDGNQNVRSQLSEEQLSEVISQVENSKKKSTHHTNRQEINKVEFKDEKIVYLKYVADSIEAIEAGEIEKVVPSRRKWVALPENFDVVQAFEKLSESYPRAFVSLVSLPGVGTWMGASPEILVSLDENRIFKTVALAGTQKAQVDKNPRDASWTQKEIEEQALVARYIINCFKKIRLREFDEIGPKTIQAGNMWHLKTEFKVDMEATQFPLLGSVMLKLLHPTSAICGMPLDTSLQFIKNNEPHNRSFFSGFLGPVNIDQSTKLYVNLRCMEVLEKEAILYAGAGVTIDSDPIKEWEETEMKCQTLIDVIFQ
jgi:isochorismate synthase